MSIVAPRPIIECIYKICWWGFAGAESMSKYT